MQAYFRACPRQNATPSWRVWQDVSIRTSNSKCGFPHGNAGWVRRAARMERSGIRDVMDGPPRIPLRFIQATCSIAFFWMPSHDTNATMRIAADLSRYLRKSCFDVCGNRETLLTRCAVGSKPGFQMALHHMIHTALRSGCRCHGACSRYCCGV